MVIKYLCIYLQQSESTDLSLFINMNLAIVYLRMGKQQDFMALLEKIDPEKMEHTKYVTIGYSYRIVSSASLSLLLIHGHSATLTDSFITVNTQKYPTTSFKAVYEVRNAHQLPQVSCEVEID